MGDHDQFSNYIYPTPQSEGDGLKEPRSIDHNSFPTEIITRGLQRQKPTTDEMVAEQMDEFNYRQKEAIWNEIDKIRPASFEISAVNKATREKVLYLRQEVANHDDLNELAA